ncbi:MAG: hypothetical protein AAB229_01200 [Candidatus Hydrogenedentota bacterium]
MIRLDAEEIEFWEDDRNGNVNPDEDEIVRYTWTHGTGGEWIRSDSRGSRALCRLAGLEVGGDTDPPSTGHIVYYLFSGSNSDSEILGGSVSVRNGIRE